MALTGERPAEPPRELPQGHDTEGFGADAATLAREQDETTHASGTEPEVFSSPESPNSVSNGTATIEAAGNEDSLDVYSIADHRPITHPEAPGTTTDVEQAFKEWQAASTATKDTVQAEDESPLDLDELVEVEENRNKQTKEPALSAPTETVSESETEESEEAETSPQVDDKKPWTPAATNTGIMHGPPSPSSKTKVEKKWWQKPATKVAAVLGVIGIGAGAVGVATMGGDSEQVSAGVVPAAGANNETTAPQSTIESTGTTTAESSPEAVFRVPRPNGEVVEIPGLPADISDPEAYANAALLLLAGVGTTTDEQARQQLLEELIPENKVAQANLVTMFDGIKDKVPEARDSSIGKTYQISIFPDSANPATFAISADKDVISLKGGNLYMSPFVSSTGSVTEWQGSGTKRKDYTYAYKVDTFEIDLRKDSTGKEVPEKISIHYSR